MKVMIAKPNHRPRTPPESAMYCSSCNVRVIQVDIKNCILYLSELFQRSGDINRGQNYKLYISTCKTGAMYRPNIVPLLNIIRTELTAA